jgi:hypothetical protein
MPWPPSRDEFFLVNNQHRPLFQGDVFGNVPFTKARFNNKPEDDPNVAVERRMVVVIGYPCDLYMNGQPVKVQSVAPVVEATKVGIPPDWSGAYTYAPLPDLLGDGKPYAAALSAVSNIDARYLVRSGRVASLSRLGWATFRQRLVLCSSRSVLLIEDLDAGGAATWEELELWTRWCETGLPEKDFTAWLEDRPVTLGGFSRRQALEQGMGVQISGLLAKHLATVISGASLK